MRKDDLRRQLKQRLESLTKPEYEEKSYRVSNQLYQLDQWQRAKTIGITISHPPEVDTYELIKQAWREGKRVAVPRCMPSTKQLDFRLLTSFLELENTYIHLWEPGLSLTRPTIKEEIDLMVVPGLAFSKEGHRLGFGGGYYDRYLVDYKGHTISLVFQEQLIPELPHEEHDLTVQRLILEESVIST